jgi:hypothetical protein
MVRKSFTAVIEKNATFTSGFATEPYEAGWASEARWFVRVLELSGELPVLMLYPQVSPDGLFWCDEGTMPLVVEEVGLYSFALRDFGGWLRLRGALTGVQPRFKVLIYLALKE